MGHMRHPAMPGRFSPESDVYKRKSGMGGIPGGPRLYGPGGIPPQHGLGDIGGPRPGVGNTLMPPRGFYPPRPMPRPPPWRHPGLNVAIHPSGWQDPSYVPLFGAGISRQLNQMRPQPSTWEGPGGTESPAPQPQPTPQPFQGTQPEPMSWKAPGLTQREWERQQYQRGRSD